MRHWMAHRCGCFISFVDAWDPIFNTGCGIEDSLWFSLWCSERIRSRESGWGKKWMLSSPPPTPCFPPPFFFLIPSPLRYRRYFRRKTSKLLPIFCPPEARSFARSLARSPRLENGKRKRLLRGLSLMSTWFTVFCHTPLNVRKE